jgi:cytochrome c oxidase assembly protein subunit 15
MKKKLFFQSAVTATILSYLLIFVGGLVRVSGSGMGCPDWPKCFGRWIPPLSVDQIPSYIDPTMFNITLAWIEYGNRMLGVLVGISIIILNILAIYYFRKHFSLLFSSLLSLVIVIAEGLLGALVVSSVLNPFIVSLHMLLALILVSVLSYICIQSFKLFNAEYFVKVEKNNIISRGLIFLWILIIIEILLGTGIRTNIELIAIDNPLLSKGEQLNALSSYKYLHSLLGFGLLFFSIYINYYLRDNSLLLAKQLGYFILAMVALQIFLGELMVFFNLPQLTRLFHTWGSSWLVGVIIILYNCMKNE